MTTVDTVGRPSGVRWIVFGLSCGTSWWLYLHRYIFALIKPKLVEQWGLGKDQLGLLDSAFSIFYTAFQIPLGIVADVVGVHFTLTALILAWSVGLALHATARSGNDLWAARAILGLGQSAVFANLSRITRHWFPRSSRTTIQGWVGVFFGRSGGLCANLLVGALLLGVLELPWRQVVLAMAAFGVVHALVFAILFRNSPRQHRLVNAAEANLIDDVEEQSRTAPSMGIREMFRRMHPRSIINLLMLNLQTILSTLADNIYSAWIPLFLFEVHNLKFAEMGVYSALPLMGGALGGATGGWLNDMLIRKTANRLWVRRSVGLAGKGVAGILLALAMIWYDHPRRFCVILFFVKFFSDWSLTTTWGVVTDISGRTSATVFAYNNSVAGIASILGPAMYGAVSEFYGWVPVFVTGSLTYIACALSWLVIDCTMPIIADAGPGDISSDKTGSRPAN